VPAAFHGLVFRTPSIPIVAIGADRRRVEVYNGTVIQEVELDQLLTVIRDLVGRRPAASVPTGPARTPGLQP
jgi:hypothetical protein